jgi:4-amino-4-deoxy-L-arabinose transferase-like glycosyltransferase
VRRVAPARDLLALAVVLVAAAVLFSRGIHGATSYDEGVYLASLDALRHGQHLGSDVFASQPPGFYVLLRVLAAPAGRSVEGIRIAFLVLALLGVVAAYVVGRLLAGPWGGLAAGALVVAAPPYAAQAARVAADAPAIALGLCSLAVAAYGLRRGSIAGPAVAGALAAAAILVKLLAVPVVVPLAVIAWQRRVGGRTAVALLAGALVVAAALAGAYAGVLSDLWRDAVTFHRHARSVHAQSAGSRIVDYFSLRTPTTWVAAAGAVAAALFRRQLALWTFVAAAILFLLLQRPLLDHHFVLLAAALASAAGTALVSGPRRLALAGLSIALLGAAAGWVQDYRQIHRSTPPEPAEVRAAAAALRTLTRPGERVASDLPIVPYLADRRLPGDLVDTSAVRFESGSLTQREVERAPVRLYVVGREFASFLRPQGNLKLVRRFGSIRILRR